MADWSVTGVNVAETPQRPQKGNVFDRDHIFNRRRYAKRGPSLSADCDPNRLSQ